MSVTVKLAAFAAFVRVLALSFEPSAICSETFSGARGHDGRGRQPDGRVQENIKRLLAYSSIATRATC